MSASASTINKITFNQDYSFFIIGTDRGFKVYSTLPQLKENLERNLDGGIGTVEIQGKSNIMALIGGGENPKYASNKLIIWDDYQNKILTEVRCSSKVLNVKLRKDYVFIVCEMKICIYDFITYQNIDSIKTYINPKGIIAMNDDEQIVCSYPSVTKGYVNVKTFDNYRTILICAHENMINALALNPKGNLLATASMKGTLIRVFDTNRGILLQELRRGAERVEIYELSFDRYSRFLACSSSKGTIHIFSLRSSIIKIKEIENRLDDLKDEYLELFPKNQKSL